jgi:hypothetical protein
MLLGALVAFAQQPTAGEKTRPQSRSHSYNAPGATYSGEGDSYQVAPQKAKAKVTGVDLEKRSITVVPAKPGGRFKVADLEDGNRSWRQVEEMELSFHIATGHETIRVGGSAAKTLDKKSITLEELKPGDEVKVEYYPIPRIVREITVERVGS